MSLLNWLYPVKTGKTLFDVWSIAHLAFWVFIGSVLWPLKVRWWIAVPSCLVVACAWEGFERFAEKRWPNTWLSPESWVNAWVSDPLTCVVGVAFMYYALEHWR